MHCWNVVPDKHREISKVHLWCIFNHLPTFVEKIPQFCWPSSWHFNPADLKTTSSEDSRERLSPSRSYHHRDFGNRHICQNACVGGKCSTFEVPSLSHHLPKELKQPELLSAPVAKPKQAGSLNLPAAPTHTHTLNLTFSSPSSDSQTVSQAVFSFVMNRESQHYFYNLVFYPDSQYFEVTPPSPQ